jgi:hypothetical protein
MNKIFFTLLIVLASCSAQKRLNRIVDRNPELIQKDTVIYYDTLIIRDTIFFSIPEINLDTSLSIQTLITPTIIKKGKLTIEIQSNETRDSLNIKAIVPEYLELYPLSYKVTRGIKVPCDKIIVQKKGNKFESLLLKLAVVLLVILNIYQFAKSRKT